MKSLVSWFATNPVAANLLMLVIVVGGLIAATAVKIELFPEFSLDAVTVSVAYPGAAPEEVEEGICVKIEEEVHGLEGVKKVTSTAVEGVGAVTIEVQTGADARRVLDDVKTRVDAIETFPEEAESPVISELLLRHQVINVALHGEVEERSLKHVAERVRDEINALPGISQVELANVRPYEISVEVSELALRRYGLTFDDVADAVRRSSLDLSGGSIKTEGGEILLRAKGQAYRGSEFEKLALVTRADGSRVLLGDVATVIDGLADTDQSARFDGNPVAMVQVFRIGDESALEISAAVNDYVATLRPTLPRGIEVDVWQDNAVWLQSRLDLLVRNGLQGLFLVFLILALFLRFRLSLWVTVGIPVSFLGVLMLMPAFDQSINMLSLFAFILVLGIVVDDAIVVGENIYNEHESGVTGRDGAVKGVREVSIPVVFGVLTTIVAFVPLVFLPGVLGKFFAMIPIVVILALAFSLIESMLVLPSHLAHTTGATERLGRVWPFKLWTLVQGRFAAGVTWFVQRAYRPFLERALVWRYLTVATAISALILTFGAVAGGRVRFVFFPDIEGDVIAARITMPQGTSAEVTAGAVARIDAAARALAAEIARGGEGDVVRHSLASVGEQPYLAQQSRSNTGAQRTSSPELGEVVLELVPSEEREITGTELADRWRELCGPIPGAVELSFDSAVMSAGKPIDVQLSGQDVEVLRHASDELRRALAGYEGVRDVTDSFRGGKQELVLDIQPQAEALGLTLRDLARQVRQGFYGEEAQRVQRGRDDVRVMVRYPEEDRRALAGVETMRLRTRAGDEVPFDEVATIEPRRGYSTIQRTDRARTIHVTADVDLAVATPNEVLASVAASVVPGIQQRYPSVQISYEGQSSDQRETIGAMARSYAIALFVIFALMAIPLRSYVQPLIIMTAIPFGVVGAIAGHMLVGDDLSVLSLLGIAALAGVVVNDSLVLVDFVNRMREQGMSVADAARRAGVMRFRPILLTSLTTFAGLMPLILEKSVQAQFLVPMAISLAFGVVFSTAISLLFVPACYLILEDLVRAWRWIWTGSTKRRERRMAGEAL